MIAPNACFLGTAPAISDESRGGCLRRVAGHRPRRLRRGHRHGATDLLDVDDATTPSTSSTWPTCSTGTTGARGAWDEVRPSSLWTPIRRATLSTCSKPTTPLTGSTGTTGRGRRQHRHGRGVGRVACALPERYDARADRHGVIKRISTSMPPRGRDRTRRTPLRGPSRCR
jgi:hypothetical protein